VQLLAVNALVAFLYAITGWMGLQFPYFGEHVTLLWIPAAIALAALVLGGPAIVPGVFVGSLALNVTIDPGHVGQGIAIAVGNTLGPVLSSHLLVHAFRFRPQMDRVRDALAYAGSGVLGTSVVTSTLGVLSLYAFGDVLRADLLTAWAAWLAGDGAGLLIVGPPILTWLSVPDPTLIKPVSRLEKTSLGISVVLFSTIVLVYGREIPTLPYAFGPLFVWSLLRLGPRGVSLAVAFVAACLMVGTPLGIGPFSFDSETAGMLSLWVFVVAVGSAAILASALISERDRALDNQARLMRELDHRVKNTLATVIALAERSADTAGDMRDYLERFVGRLRAVARTHEGMARSKWHPMNLADIVAMTLAPFDGAVAYPVHPNGEKVQIDTVRVAPVTMLLHELATNAAKYGAWSRPGGRVSVAWKSSAKGDLVFSWTENGGPAVTSTPSPGYGLRLIEGLVHHELGGEAEFEFAENGLVCRVRIPLGD